MSRILIRIFVPLILLGGCSPTDLSWSEEAQQDDGSIILVKTTESAQSLSPLPLGNNVTGYRFLQLEFTIPSTGAVAVWKPAGIPRINPLALHVYRAKAYLFTIPYLAIDYNELGCPLPPYIIFEFDGAKWNRIRIEDLPVHFKLVNLLLSSANGYVEQGYHKQIQQGTVIKFGSIDRRERVAPTSTEEYLYRLTYDNVGPFDRCNTFGNNLSTKFGKLEFK